MHKGLKIKDDVHESSVPTGVILEVKQMRGIVRVRTAEPLDEALRNPPHLLRKLGFDTIPSPNQVDLLDAHPRRAKVVYCQKVFFRLD